MSYVRNKLILVNTPQWSVTILLRHKMTIVFQRSNKLAPKVGAIILTKCLKLQVLGICFVRKNGKVLNFPLYINVTVIHNTILFFQKQNHMRTY